MTRFHFFILVLIVSISGFSQGMLLPVISVIFEQEGHSAALNGLHATGLYIGVLLASPFMEAPLRRLGFKPLIVIGGIMVGVSLFSFTLIQSYIVWFFLRLLIGIGDHMLHFSTQTWVTTLSSEKNRGRNISLYGLSFGLGFAAGPFLTPLVEISPSLPFIVSGVFSLMAWLFIFFLKNDFPEKSTSDTRGDNSLKRFFQAFLLGWIAFLPTFGYGFLETALNGNFPVYALRSGISVEGVSIILPAFAIGSIVFQYPLGILSDKFGRRNVLLVILAIGAGCFFAAGLSDSVPLVAACFFAAGMAVGSTFSLGISFMADLLPKPLLPAGNLMCGITFSFGSIFGPIAGGWYMQTFENGNLFYLITLVMALIWLGVLLGKSKNMKASAGQSEAESL
ncbi:MFS transporter [Bacillus sonorensis]|uniref:Transcriptional regulator n=2 Tax=Bacillus sonorensis TaxID=119858 RepID=M5PCI2_9BACI|nr:MULTISPECIES: MFS transporter [Bacillus]TWK77128.1 putative MFS-type transporter YcaD [Bacillus paralicheniformis]ASB87572.1 putative MFS-type transporter YfkF [Bacillus sonorensis]EME72912.1 transcriptional regulator [Bacillus sonorensis L12]MBG9916352.1 MFS transporter [Bacillus sonorensis]MCY7859506.1 MFS transporter [Bacillus sonorensis]